MRKVTLKQIGYFIMGEADLALWGGGEGTIQIDSTEIKGKFTKEKLLTCVNDGRFGCEKILQVEARIYDLFENGYKEYNRTIYLNEKRCEQGQRGI